MNEKKSYDAITGIDEDLLDRSLQSGSGHPVSGRKKLIILAAVMLTFAAAIALFLTAVFRMPKPQTPLPEWVTAQFPETTIPVSNDRYQTANPVDVVPQWERPEGLKVLTAIQGETEVPSELSLDPAFRLLDAEDTSGVSRSVSVSILGGAKISRSLSGRFVELTFKPDEASGVDTAVFGDYTGIYYDLEKEDVICVGYEVAEILNADREDEIEQIFLMLSGADMHINSAELYDLSIRYNSFEYEGWQSLIADRPGIVERHFGWTESQYELLHEFFRTGRTDYQALAESLESDCSVVLVEYKLTKARNLAIHDGVGELQIFGLVDNGRYALVGRNVEHRQNYNLAYVDVYGILYDREMKTLTELDLGDRVLPFFISQDQTRCVLSSDATRLLATTGGRVYIYDVSGHNYEVIAAYDLESGVYFPQNLRVCGDARISPSERYLCLKMSPEDGQPSDRWLLTRFSADPAPRERAFVIGGTFVRFARDDSVVIFRSDKGYRFYSTETGRDVTGSFTGEDALELAAHEYYDLAETAEGLFSVHVLTGDRVLLASAGQYDAYTADPEFSCLYLASLRERTVACIPLTGETETHSIRIQTAFLDEMDDKDIVSLDCVERGTTLILSYFRPKQVRLDTQALTESLEAWWAKFPNSKIGLVDKLREGFFYHDVLTSIQYNGAYLHYVPGEDPNLTANWLGWAGWKLTLPWISELISDDLLLDEEDMLDLAWMFSKKIVEYIDIDPDGTVHLSQAAREELFGVGDLNSPHSFIRNTYYPFVEANGSGPDLFKRFAEVNIRSVMDESPERYADLTDEVLSSFVLVAAERLETVYAPHFSKQYNMYEDVNYPDLLIFKEAVRKWADEWLTDYAEDPDTVAGLIASYPLTGVKPYFGMSEWEKAAAGITDP